MPPRIPALPATASLRRDVETLATPAGRRVGDPGHDAARTFLLGRLRELDLAPYSGPTFELGYPILPTVRGTNLIALLPGSAPHLPPLLLGAHYDTCGKQPGADDNAAAIAAVLGAVPALRSLALRRSIVVALFDSEEPPHFLQPTMGSIRFEADQRTGPIGAAIVLDLVGHRVPVPGVEDLLFVLGAESGPDMVHAIGAAAVPAGLRVLPTQHAYASDLSDHVAFRRAGQQFLFLSSGQWPDYHEVTDTPEKLDYGKIAAVSGYLVALAQALDARELGPAVPQETLELELAGWRRCWTPQGLPPALAAVPRSRGDIEGKVAAILRSFGM